MNAANQDESRLDAAVTTIMSEKLDDIAIERVTQQALRLYGRNQTPVAATPVPAADRVTSSWLWLGSLAASAAVALMLVVWFPANDGSTAFAQVVERVLQIRNVQFVIKMQMHSDPASVVTVMIQGDVRRGEFGPEPDRLVTILNTATRETLHLDPSRKVAQYSTNRPEDSTEIVNPIAELAAAKSKSIRSLGKDRINGREVDVYRVRDLPVLGCGKETEMTLWADTVTHLPVRIAMQDTDPRHKMSLTFDDFQWNTDLSDELFAMKIPDGFKNGIIFEEISDSEFKSRPPQYAQDIPGGVLFSGRVPSRLAVDYRDGTVTSLLRDPEKQQRTMNHLPHEIRQWDASTGQQLWVQSVGGAGDFAICSSKDLLATVEGQEIQLRQLSTGTMVRTWESEHITGVVAISHDGARLAHGYTRWGNRRNNQPVSGGVEIWDAGTGRLERSITDMERVDYLEFSPKSDLLVVCSAEWKTRLYNATTGDLEYSSNYGSRAAFSPDGTLLATISPQLPSSKVQGRIDIVDLTTKQVIRSVVSTEGKANSWLLALAFSPDGTRLGAADWNGNVNVWDVRSGDLVQGVDALPNGVHSLRFLSTNQLVTGCEDGTLRLHTLAK